MTATTRMQKGDLGAAEADTHGAITKKTVHLDGVDVTEVTFGVGADGRRT